MKHNIDTNAIIKLAETSKELKDYMQKKYPEVFGLNIVFIILNVEGIETLYKFAEYRFKYFVRRVEDFPNEMAECYGDIMMSLNHNEWRKATDEEVCEHLDRYNAKD